MAKRKTVDPLLDLPWDASAADIAQEELNHVNKLLENPHDPNRAYLEERKKGLLKDIKGEK